MDVRCWIREVVVYLASEGGGVLGQNLGAEVFKISLGNGQTKMDLAVEENNFKRGDGDFLTKNLLKEGPFGKLGEVGQK